MIYFGVKLFPNAFKIVALSQSFTFLGKRFFITDHFDKSNQWADDLKLELYESAQWFFDDKEFKNPKYPALLFQLLKSGNTIYLVNNRRLLEMMKFLYDWQRYIQIRPINIETAYVLASATRFFDEEHLMPVHPNEVHLYLKD